MKKVLKEKLDKKEMETIQKEIRRMVAKVFFDLYLKRSSWGAN